jgi:hypothetical protein
MLNNQTRRGLLGLSLAAICAATPALAGTCRVTDFTDKPLSQWNELQRASFTAEMLRTEFTRLNALKPGDPNYYAPIANAANLAEAKRTALERLQATKVENIDGYRQIWNSDMLSDEGMRKFADCVTGRQPGLFAVGRFEAPGQFHLTFSHLTPIGIEKIETKLVASSNIANVAEFEAYLANLGWQDNYPARTFALRLIDPAKRAVLVMRAGWESPLFVYIPVNPATVELK